MAQDNPLVDSLVNGLIRILVHHFASLLLKIYLVLTFHQLIGSTFPRQNRGTIKRIPLSYGLSTCPLFFSNGFLALFVARLQVDDVCENFESCHVCNKRGLRCV